METVNIQPRYYSVKEIQKMENCGRDYAYDLAKKLPHERRGKGRDIYVFAEEYNKLYEEKKEKAKQLVNMNAELKSAKVYQIRKLS